MICVILGLGAVAVLVTVLVRTLSATLRCLVCWTFGSVAACAASVVYFCSGGTVRAELGSVLAGAFGALTVGLIALVIELFSPSKRLRGKRQTEYDSERAENALNIIMAILAASAALSAAVCERCGAQDHCILGLVSAAAVCLRQLSYFMYRAKLDTARSDDAAVQRACLLKTLSVGRRRL